MLWVQHDLDHVDEGPKSHVSTDKSAIQIHSFQGPAQHNIITYPNGTVPSCTILISLTQIKTSFDEVVDPHTVRAEI